MSNGHRWRVPVNVYWWPKSRGLAVKLGLHWRFWSLVCIASPSEMLSRVSWNLINSKASRSSRQQPFALLEILVAVLTRIYPRTQLVMINRKVDQVRQSYLYCSLSVGLGTMSRASFRRHKCSAEAIALERLAGGWYQCRKLLWRELEAFLSATQWATFWSRKVGLGLAAQCASQKDSRTVSFHDRDAY